MNFTEKVVPLAEEEKGHEVSQWFAVLLSPVVQSVSMADRGASAFRS